LLKVDKWFRWILAATMLWGGTVFVTTGSSVLYVYNQLIEQIILMLIGLMFFIFGVWLLIGENKHE
jgi:SNF family Na+-dependent transporter